MNYSLRYLLTLSIVSYFNVLSFFGYAFTPNCSSITSNLKLRIGLISVGEWMITFQIHLMHNNTLKKCRITPTYNPLMDEKRLHMPERGWTNIKQSLLAEMGTSEFKPTLLVIGPYYANLAMIMDEVEMPYIVTDEKGNLWTDRSRTQDSITWRNTIYIRPSAKEQNQAVVDLFVLKKWEGGVMVMPANTEDNYECQDLANQMLYAGKYLVKYTINTTSPDVMKNRIDSVIKNSLYITQTRYIICSPRESRQNLSRAFLDEANNYKLLKDENRIFVFIDPTSGFEPLSGNNYFNMKLYTAKCKLYAFRYIEMDRFEMFPQQAVAQDVAEVTRRALLSYAPYYKGSFNIDRFMYCLKSVKIEDGKTGLVAFNETGQRVNYTLSLYQHGQDNTVNDPSKEKIGIWRPGENTTPNERLTFLKGNNSNVPPSRSLFSNPVMIMVVKEEPFVFENKDGHKGFTIDLLNELKKRLNFEYKIHISQQYGVKNKSGHWNGIIEAVRSGDVHLGMGALSVTSERDKDVDFSLGIMTTGINILINKPQSTQHIFQFLVSFTAHLWMAILGTVVGVSFLFIILDYSNVDRKFTVKETLWFSIGTLMTRGTDFSPKRTSQRILTTGFTFFVLVIVSTYTANLAAFLTMPTLDKPVNSLEELQESNMRCGTVKDSNTMTVIRNQFPVLFEKMERYDGFKTTRESIQEANTTSYAFVFDFLINSYAEMTNCGTMKTSSPVLLMEHGIAMKEGAPFKTKINIELLKMKEDGLIEKLFKRWWQDQNRCYIRSSKLQLEQFDVGHTAGAFIILGVGLTSALAFFLFKKFYLKSKDMITQQGIRSGKNKISVNGEQQQQQQQQ